MDLNYISKFLNSHEKCIKYLEKERWNNVPTCPYCASTKSSPKKLRHTCLSCSKSYSVTVGTVFHSTNLPLQKWLMAICLMLSAKKGISALQLSRDIKVNKNTAWLMQMKIRKIRRTLLSYRPQDLAVKGVWSLLKRAIIGQYHHIDVYYLHRYVDELKFKLSVRGNADLGYGALMAKMLFG